MKNCLKKLSRFKFLAIYVGLMVLGLEKYWTTSDSLWLGFSSFWFLYSSFESMAIWESSRSKKPVTEKSKM